MLVNKEMHGVALSSFDFLGCALPAIFSHVVTPGKSGQEEADRFRNALGSHAMRLHTVFQSQPFDYRLRPDWIKCPDFCSTILDQGKANLWSLTEKQRGSILAAAHYLWEESAVLALEIDCMDERYAKQLLNVLMRSFCVRYKYETNLRRSAYGVYLFATPATRLNLSGRFDLYLAKLDEYVDFQDLFLSWENMPDEFATWITLVECMPFWKAKMVQTMLHTEYATLRISKTIVRGGYNFLLIWAWLFCHSFSLYHAEELYGLDSLIGTGLRVNANCCCLGPLLHTVVEIALLRPGPHDDDDEDYRCPFSKIGAVFACAVRNGASFESVGPKGTVLDTIHSLRTEVCRKAQTTATRSKYAMEILFDCEYLVLETAKNPSDFLKRERARMDCF